MTLEYVAPAISCGHCKSRIETAIAVMDGVERVRVDVAAQTVRVEGAVDDAALRDALAAIGYPAES